VVDEAASTLRDPQLFHNMTAADVLTIGIWNMHCGIAILPFSLADDSHNSSMSGQTLGRLSSAFQRS
jgi:hypothetical protein